MFTLYRYLRRVQISKRLRDRWETPGHILGECAISFGEGIVTFTPIVADIIVGMLVIADITDGGYQFSLGVIGAVGLILTAMVAANDTQ